MLSARATDARLVLFFFERGEPLTVIKAHAVPRNIPPVRCAGLAAIADFWGRLESPDIGMAWKFLY